MNLFSILSAVSAPKSLWVTLINWIESSVGNLGWTIILVTLLIKVVTTPLDFFVKLNTKKQTLVQQKCSPQIAKLQKKYGEDRNTLRVQSQLIYKREGMDQRSGCLIMLINTILSFVIFITFYNDLRKVSAYEAINQYEQIQATYETSTRNYFIDKNSEITEYNITADNDDELNQFILKYNNSKFVKEQNDSSVQEITIDEDGDGTKEKTLTSSEITDYITFFNKYNVLVNDIVTKASNDVVNCWKASKNKSSWLWVQNIWVADSTSKPFPTYSGLISIAKNTGYTPYAKSINETDYNKIASLISSNAERQNNGYYLLPIIAGLITFASQYVTELHTRLKNKKANKVAKTTGVDTAATMKTMKIIMPVIMAIFVLTASASFGLYILSSNVSSIVLGELTTFGVDAITKKQRLAVEAELEKEANKMIKKGQIKE